MKGAAAALILVAAALSGGCASQRAGGTLPSAGPSVYSYTPRAFSIAATQTAPLLERVSWGSSPSALTQVNRQGADAWLNAQLRARDDAMPSQIQQQIDAMEISRRPMQDLLIDLEQQRKQVNERGSDADKDAAQKAYQAALNNLARENATRFLLRAAYSPNQLRQQMAWFWLNHFSIFQGKANLRAMVGDFEEQALRPHLMGKFRDLLRATAFHPAMLRYLDNERNAVGQLNENYARELMELHTLGVDGGYTQADVQELARVLSGLGVNVGRDAPRLRPALHEQYRRRGAFEFNPRRHDFGDKRLLGRGIQGGGLAEVEQALDILANHPATARFISRKLAWYFTGAEPDAELLQVMERSWRASDGTIAQVLGALFASPQFRASLGRQFKDPIHYLVSAVRLACDGKPLDNPQPMLGWLNRLGQPLNGRQTPDGYSLDPAAWSNPGQMTARFELAQALARGAGGCQMNAQMRPEAPPLAQASVASGLDARLGPASRNALGQARDRVEWNTLLLASPEFMQR